MYRYTTGDVYTIRLTLKTNRGCDATVTKNFRLYEVKPFAGNDTILARGKPCA